MRTSNQQKMILKKVCRKLLTQSNELKETYNLHRNSIEIKILLTLY